MEKKFYDTPEVTKVQFDASDRITVSGCTLASNQVTSGDPQCSD